MEAAIFGNSRYGGVKMRGVDVAKTLGCDFIEVSNIPKAHRWDVGLLVKYHDEKTVQQLRESCDRLIYDPLDSFVGIPNNGKAVPFWRKLRGLVGFDELIASSIACRVKMKEALPTIPVHVLRHHCDSSIQSNYYDKDGPIVYAGSARYIKDLMIPLTEAAESLGRQIIFDTSNESVNALCGASLAIALRCKTTEIEEWCKPGIKIENAAAGRIPVLASPHPCIRTLRDGGIVYLEDETELAVTMLKALGTKRPMGPVRLEDHCQALNKIFERSKEDDTRTDD